MAVEQDSKITEDMLKKALANQFKVPEIEIEILEWKSGVGSGAADNFACDMVSIKGTAKIKGSIQEFSYMTKLAKVKADMLRSVDIVPYFGNIWFEIICSFQLGIFEKEYLMYAMILPKVQKAREEHNLKAIKLPKCYYADPDPGKLVMENLKDNEFQMIKSKENGIKMHKYIYFDI